MARFYKTSSMQPIDYGFELPIELMAKGLLYKEGQQEAALSSLMEMSNLGEVREQDQGGLNSFSSYLKNNIDEMSKMDLTSADGRRKFMEFSNQVKEAVGPNGMVGGMYSDKAAEDAEVERIMKLKGVNPKRQQEMAAMARDQPSSYSEYDFNNIEKWSGDKYNRYGFGGHLEQVVDFVPTIQEILAKNIPSSMEVVRGYHNGQQTMKFVDKETREIVSKSEILNQSFGSVLSNNEGIMNYYNEGVGFGEYDIDPQTGEPISNHIIQYESGVDKEGNKLYELMGNPNTAMGRMLDAISDQLSYSKIVDSRDKNITAHGTHIRNSDYDLVSTPVFDFTSEPTTVTPQNYSQASKSAEEKTTALQQEADNLENAGFGLSLSVNGKKLSKLSTEELTEAIPALVNMNKSGDYAGQLSTLIQLANEVHLEKSAVRAIEDRGYDYFINNVAKETNLVRNKNSALESFKSDYKNGEIYFSNGRIWSKSGNYVDQYGREFLKKFEETLNSEKATNNEFKVNNTQSPTFKIYKPNGDFDETRSAKLTKSVSEMAKTNNWGNAVFFKLDKSGKTVERGMPVNSSSINITDTSPGGPQIVYDQFVRSDGYQYAIITDNTGTKFALDMQSAIVDGKKVEQQAPAAVSSFIVRLIKSGVNKYELPHGLEVIVDDKKSISYLNEDKSLHNGNAYKVIYNNKQYTDENALNLLINYHNDISKLPSIK